MSKGFKPGDVALVHNEWGVWNVAICTLRAHEDGLSWRYGVSDVWEDVEGSDARPLVVIDPDDAEQVERLRALYVSEAVDRGAMASQFSGQDDKRRDAMQAALREFASPTPPKPDEPAGLGAVVEDAEGRLWLRTTVPADDDDNYGKPWTIGGVRKNWQILDAVRVLSEGVTP